VSHAKAGQTAGRQPRLEYDGESAQGMTVSIVREVAEASIRLSVKCDRTSWLVSVYVKDHHVTTL
jgi:hypothetical protein